MQRLKSMMKLALALALAAGALVISMTLCFHPPARAQTEDIAVHKQLGRASPTVFVGEYLTFTIRITNNSNFTVTTLPLLDLYNAGVLGYADAVPPPDSVDEDAGQIDWDDLTTTFGDLPPGGEILVVVGFIAEHPQTAIVNYAEVHDAEGTEGDLEGGNSDDVVDESIGGSSPVDKELVSGEFPQAGQALTFTVLITNAGYTTMTVAPLVDIYDPEWLTFSYAVPPPDFVDAARGVLTWTDLTLWSGDIPPHQAISVTTVFTALAAITGTHNQAEVVHAQDWYSNDMAGGSDLVPITIIEPTPVRLLYFRATRWADHRVRLAWATGVEIDNVGFNLYRASSLQGASTPEEAVPEWIAFVPSRAHGGGASYVYDDVITATHATWWYWLADVDTAGQERAAVVASVAKATAFHTVYLPCVLKLP